ncbi:MAG TPA: beta-ketoacyl synthase chain length factor [Burkholderiales bacterium]|nr:beta-ketoacyl synthase chain length factor [Burkholderiales bacterium]
MRTYVEGIGLIGPGLPGWHDSRAVLAGTAPYHPVPAVIPASLLLPPAERRRAGLPVKLALAAGAQAFAAAGRDASATATVFTSSSADGQIVHELCATLAAPGREVSPTKFMNSVHNAAAGYWSIATRSHEPSTSLCCYDASFAAGLLECAAQVAVDRKPVALIAYDEPYPEPLHATRPIGGEFGVALLLTPQSTEESVAALDITLVPPTAETRLPDGELEAARLANPAARALPLLAALARLGMEEVVVLNYVAGACLHARVTACD